MRILTLNYGSTNLKWAVFENERRVESGRQDAVLPDDIPQVVRSVHARVHSQGSVTAVVHRVVHGGRLTRTCFIDESVRGEIERASAYSPIHNRRALVGIDTFAKESVPQIAVFDTAFHASIPPHARAYGLPRSFYDEGLHRYGFHGISFAYLVRAVADFLGRPPDEVHGVFLHLGGGASACAVSGGQSIDTSMGLTPLEGLIMASRSGDIDPGLILYLINRGMPPADVESLLTERSGLTGLGNAPTAREVIERAEEGDETCRSAVEVFAYRVRKYIGAYYAVLPRCDVLVFSGGIGQNSPFVRTRVCAELTHLGIHIDHERNLRNETEITAPPGKVRVLVIPTDEELQMYREAVTLLKTAEHRATSAPND